jgi:hypothetical protein
MKLKTLAIANGAEVSPPLNAGRAKYLVVGARAQDPAAERVTEFLRERLKRVALEGGHGKSIEMSRAMGISPAHMSNILAGKAGIGERARKAGARLIGMTIAELEAAALGKPIAPPPGVLDYRNPDHFARIARALGRELGIGASVVDAFLIRIETNGIPNATELVGELRLFDGIVAASRAAPPSKKNP